MDPIDDSEVAQRRATELWATLDTARSEPPAARESPDRDVLDTATVRTTQLRATPRSNARLDQQIAERAAARAAQRPATRPSGAPPGLLGVVALPGVALWKRTPVVGALLVITGVMAPAFALLMLLQHRDDLVGLFTRPNVLRGLGLVAIAGITSRIVAVWLTADRLRDPWEQRRMRNMGSLVVLALALPTTVAVLRMEQTREVVEKVFQQEGDVGAVTVAPAIDPLAGQFHTVLLVGSDEGADRLGLRTDSMILAMVHEDTGRVALISVPRNLTELHFAPGSALDERYPDGYEDDEGGLINALYGHVQNDDELEQAYSRDGLEPGMLALMEGLSTSLGITVDDYLHVNSCGFVKVVDALGGVTIDVETELPMPGRLLCSNYHLTPTIGPGETYMDGTKALGYVRSRAADSDYQRMERQRILIETIVDKIGVDDLLLRFDDLVDAIEDNVFMSMTVTEARTLLATLQASDAEIESVGLTPPLAEPGDPDYVEIKALMQSIRQSLAAGTPLDLPTDTTTG